MNTMRLILIVIHESHVVGEHWRLAAVQPSNTTITFYDSSRTMEELQSNSINQQIAIYFKYRFFQEFTMIDGGANQQNNNYDCGVFGRINQYVFF